MRIGGHDDSHQLYPWIASTPYNDVGLAFMHGHRPETHNYRPSCARAGLATPRRPSLAVQKVYRLGVAVASDRATFVPGEPVWVMEANGAQRRAEYLGARVASVWRAGPPMVFVLYADNHSAEAVEMDRVIPRRATA